MAIGGYVELTVKFAKEGDQWTVVCLEMGTSAFGDSFEEADQAIRDLILLHINTLEDLGARKEFFRKHGIQFHKRKPKRAVRRLPVGPEEMVGRLMEPVPTGSA